MIKNHMEKTAKKINYKYIVWALISFFILIVGFVSFRRYYCFDYIDMDLAAYNQIVWNIVHGSFYSSMLGVNFLGHHAHFILFLFAPFYFLFQTPLFLLFLQIVSLAVCAYPIFMIASRELDQNLALSLVIAYLLYPAMGYTVFYEFHVPVFATAFLTFMLYYFIKQKYRLFALFMILSLLTQENIPLVIIPFGIFALFKKRSMKWWLLPLLSGSICFLAVVGWLMPYLNKNTVQFVTIYGHMGNSLPEILGFIISRPWTVIKMMLSAQKVKFLFQLFAPLCFFPLLDAHILISGLFFVQHLLSSRSPEYMIEYHYDAEILPFIFISAVYGIKRFLNWPLIKRYLRPALISALLLAVSITCAVSFGPFIEIAVDKYKTTKDVWDLQKERFLEMIPAEASIVATFEFLPMLSQRKQLYSFHHVVHGFHTLSRVPYRLPQGVEYALLDVNDPIGVNVFYKKGRSEANIAAFLNSNKWGIVEMLDNIVLLQNNHKSDKRFFRTLSKQPDISIGLNALIGREISLLGYDIDKTIRIKGGSSVAVKFFWKALKKIETDYRMIVEINDAEGKTRYQTIRPLCYRVFPSYMWAENSVIEENYQLFIPKAIEKENFTVNIKMVDAGTGNTMPILLNNDKKQNINLERLEILKR
ncbi:MAG: DUF2079 domain-containing protein [Candidatus Omnitrophica bacterium]|nr:DUF2079 domain-containing protein [Candidatus Omnitrophota bacterium]